MGKTKDNVFDAYSRNARLKPALIAILPAGLTVLSWSPAIAGAWSVLWTLIVWSGGTLLLAQMGRDLGKKKEPFLYNLWGGKPSTRMLRHHDAPNKTTLQRRHDKLRKLISGIVIPSSQEETADPAGADDVYESCVTYLRTVTRDVKKFPLVFEENCNYGFRRNLWGMKPIGVALSLLGTIVLSVTILMSTAISWLLMFGLVMNLLFLVGWLLWFTSSWVRIPADAYAERLLEACDKI